MVAEKATWSEHGTHFKAESAVSYKDGLDSVVFSKDDAVIRFLFEGRLDGKEGIDRCWPRRRLFAKDSVQCVEAVEGRKRENGC